jgi:hypothetical protein
MATIAAVEKQILACEGFRVRLIPLSDKTKSIPDYGFTVMAPQRWRISDWKNERLAAYFALVKGVTVFRGDGEPVQRDMQLGNLRDGYYQAVYGKVTTKPSNVVLLDRSKQSGGNGRAGTGLRRKR